ncbi:unnamed protein product [Parajaminaea phylloscopi]
MSARDTGQTYVLVDDAFEKIVAAMEEFDLGAQVAPNGPHVRQLVTKISLDQWAANLAIIDEAHLLVAVIEKADDEDGQAMRSNLRPAVSIGADRPSGPFPF